MMRKLVIGCSVAVAAVVASAAMSADYVECSTIIAEGNGSQGKMPYIATGYSPNQSTRLVMGLNIQGTVEYWFGCWDGAYNRGAFAMGNDGGNTYVGWDGQGGGSSFLIPTGEHTIELNAGTVYVDGEVWRTFNSSIFSINNTIFLFFAEPQRCAQLSAAEHGSDGRLLLLPDLRGRDTRA